MSRLLLIAASDDYLLEEGLTQAIEEIRELMPGVSVQVLSEEISPEDLAVEICTPSLFDPERLLVVRDVRPWVDAPAPPDGPKKTAAPAVDPLVRILDDGLPEGVGLALGAWCGAKPKGDLIKAVGRQGELRWTPLPPPPKPWEDVALSDEQRSVLGTVLRRAAAGVQVQPAAERLLLDRLGFAPRLLAQEVEKLVTAAGEAGTVDEDLVRQLTFPRERSLEVVRDAVLNRDFVALFDLIAAAANGVPLRDWRGQRVEAAALPPILFGQIFNLFSQLLYLQRLSLPDLQVEMDPRRTAARGWYGSVFKRKLGPELERRLAEDGHSPLFKGAKPPSAWTLHQLFAGAGRYSTDLLIAALAEAGKVEQQLRSPAALDALSAWLSSMV